MHPLSHRKRSRRAEKWTSVSPSQKGATIGAMKEVVGSITKEQLMVSARSQRGAHSQRSAHSQSHHSQRNASESEHERGLPLPSAVTRFRAGRVVALSRQ
jgi:hypothetical protein